MTNAVITVGVRRGESSEIVTGECGTADVVARDVFGRRAPGA